MINRISYSVIFCCTMFFAQAQTDTLARASTTLQTEKNTKPKYYRQEEILFEGKRYRLYNNYVTLGPVLAASSIRSSSQKGIGVDFNWHIRRQYFQTGFMMSGLNFGDNNHVSGHLTAGLRKERSFYNLAAFIGPCYSYGVEGDITTGPLYYSSFGAYISAQYAVKLSYDVGIGIEAFSEISYKQFLTGVKIIAFFSGGIPGTETKLQSKRASRKSKMAEVIIVGSGLAACCLMHRFAEASVPFSVVSQPALSSSSQVAAGIWNPVVFKRYTKSWMADTLLPEMLRFFSAIEQQSKKKLLYPRSIVRALADEHEKALWFAKSKNELDEYLDPQLCSNRDAFPGLNLPAEFGIVRQAGNLDLPAFLAYTTERFKKQIIEEKFEHSQLTITSEGLRYKQLNAKAIVFCEGWLIKDNPFFNWLPFKPAKGEVLTLSAEGLQLKEHISNRSSFLFEQENGEFRCGATYEWKDLNEASTLAAREELMAAYATHTDLPARIIAHQSGVRPATIDRRPVLGRHPEHANLFVFNGLGSKGVMLAPYFSKKFVNFYLNQEALTADVNLRRFYPIYEQSKLS